MNRNKISFGKINLNPNKPAVVTEKPAESQHDASSSVTSVGGFKKMGKQQLIRQVEEVTEDMESQHLKEIMGISGFGRKTAKVFDINEQIAKAREVAPPKPRAESEESKPVGNDDSDDEPAFGPLPPEALSTEKDGDKQTVLKPKRTDADSDDDDDDDEEDDDDDYLDRLFDDILGDDDDEDDDDEDTPAVASAPVAAAPVPAAPIEDLAPVGQSAVSGGISDGVDLPLESGNAADAVAAGNAADDANAVSSNNNEGNLKNNIIEMNNDAFQERHNQFIDSIFSRINRIVADNYDPFVVRLHARAATKKSGAASGSSAGYAASVTKGKPAKSSMTNRHKLKNTKSEPRALDEEPRRMAVSDAKVQSKLQEQLQQLQLQQEQSIKAVAAVKKADGGDAKLAGNVGDAANAAATLPEMRTVLNGEANKANASAGGTKKTSNKAHKTHTKKSQANANTHNNSNAGTKLKQNTKNNGNSNNSNNNAHGAVGSGKEIEKLQKAEGSLSGLASLKRVGNVKVVADPEGSNSTIKAKFTLGPLTLRVEKSFKRGSVHSVKSATARTNEMIGRIKFGVVNDRATLMSIKVQQPKQVEVESKDNHDRTREFVWRRTPKIAKLVNEKLKLAAESLFTTQGVEVVRL
uniref:Gastrulation defective protein 1 n=1 Tax=Bactrocera latifrons TaxID=174628 RepID=A0A0K8V8K9_BACLA